VSRELGIFFEQGNWRLRMGREETGWFYLDETRIFSASLAPFSLLVFLDDCSQSCVFMISRRLTKWVLIFMGCSILRGTHPIENK
jgi:hypothetical protein